MGMRDGMSPSCSLNRSALNTYPASAICALKNFDACRPASPLAHADQLEFQDLCSPGNDGQLKLQIAGNESSEAATGFAMHNPGPHKNRAGHLLSATDIYSK